MKIHLATDHAGYETKEAIKSWLLEMGDYDIIDHGANEYDSTDDYPDYIIPAAQAVGGDIESLGIIFGGSGQGEAIVANRYPNVRTAVFYGGRMPIVELESEGTDATDDLDFIRLSRKHNDANMLSVGVRFVTLDEIKAAITAWLQAEFSGADRHVRRLSKIDSTYEA